MMRNGCQPEPSVLDRLQTALAHRGRDGHGRYLGGCMGIINTRLAIIALSTGNQPFREASGCVSVVNGEIYNDLELRAHLSDAPFRSGSDCESALHLYRAKGIEFANYLRGMYAIAIFDPSSSKLLLARDPFGIKPLYYVEAPTYFAFASEPQALISAGLAERQLRSRAIAELFQLKFTTGADTIYEQIRRVLPGSTLAIADGRIIDRRSQGALPEGGPRQLDYREALNQLDQVLRDSVWHHLRSDVPYGLFLSGGIDSSTVLKLMAERSSRPVVTFTCGFPGSKGGDEHLAAERIARSVGADCQVVEMTEHDFWNHAPRVAAALDDPTTDAAALPTFMLAKAAATHGVKVVLTGEGGDEMFCGYSRYRRVRRFWGMLTRNPRTRGELNPLLRRRSKIFEGWRSGLDRVEIQQAREQRTLVQTWQAVDCSEWLPNDLLVKLDRCLMTHGVEGRTPFLDPIVSEFAFRLPDDFKVTAKITKRLLRDWSAINVPAGQAYARKIAFNPPVGEWIAERRSLVERLVLKQPGIIELFSPDDVRYAFADPQKTPQLSWTLLFYALWHSHHVIDVSCEGTVEDILHATECAA